MKEHLEKLKQNPANMLGNAFEVSENPHWNPRQYREFKSYGSMDNKSLQTLQNHNAKHNAKLQL